MTVIEINKVLFFRECAVFIISLDVSEITTTCGQIFYVITGLTLDNPLNHYDWSVATTLFIIIV